TETEAHQSKQQSLMKASQETERMFESAQTKVLQTKEKIEKSHRQLDDMEKKLAIGNEKIAKMSSKIEMLEEMRENYQGFFNGVKAVLQASKHDQLEQIYGPVIDLINIPTEYMNAMETVLGAQSQ